MFHNNNAVIIQRPPDSSEDIDPLLIQKMGKRAFQAMLVPINADEPKLTHTQDGDKKLFTMHEFKVIQEKDRYVMKAKAEPVNVHALMWQIARDGHKKGQATGSTDFKRQAWLYGTYHGLEMQGHQPTADDQKALKFLRDNTQAVSLSKDRSKETAKQAAPAKAATAPAKASTRAKTARAPAKKSPAKTARASGKKPAPSKTTPTSDTTAQKGKAQPQMIDLYLENLRNEPAAFKIFMEQLNKLKDKFTETEHQKVLQTRLRKELPGTKFLPVKALVQQLSKDYEGTLQIIKDLQSKAVKDLLSKVKPAQSPPVKSTGPGM